MNEFAEPTTGSSCLLSAEDIKSIYLASLRSEDPVAKLATIASVNPWNAIAVANTPIEHLDRGAGVLHMTDRLGSSHGVRLGYEAAAALDLAIGDRRSGPILVDAGGFTLQDDADTHDYLREVIGFVDARTLDLPWSIELIRESVFAEMVDFGTPLHIAQAQAGLGDGCPSGAATFDIDMNQRAAADWWSYRLGMEPPPAFLLVETWNMSMPRFDGARDHSRFSNRPRPS